MITQDWQWEPIDKQLASLLTVGLDDAARQALGYAIRILSHQVRQGDVCLLLSDYAGQSIDGVKLPILTQWLMILKSSIAVGQPGTNKPLILDDSHKLYFQRYWNYEHELVAALKERISAPLDDFQVKSTADDKHQSLLLSEQQRTAIQHAINSGLTMITGGPGTGKTTTIVGLIRQLLVNNPGFRIALAAPTGKAAARIQQALLENDLDLADHIHATTVHRLLGYKYGRVEFRHHGCNLLPHDVVIVDEASMIDLALMSKLVNAVKKNARLILLGDADQLVSVENGAVFGELCRASKGSVLEACIQHLQYNYRFVEYPGIGKLADAVNTGDHNTALSLLGSDQYPEIMLLQQEFKQFDQCLFDCISDLVTIIVEPLHRLQKLNQFQLLCAHRKGKWGVEALNQEIETWLQNHNFIASHSQFYNGKPIIINRNNYQLDLFNGDIGVLAQSESGELKAYFSKTKSEAREMSVSRLTSYTSAWALTVHQSQGSEFDHVLLVLPEEISPVLSRELIYTAITRARKSIQIMGDKEILKKAIRMRVNRQSGITSQLQ